MDQVNTALDRIAEGQTVDIAGLPAELRPLAEAAQLLAAEGRAVTPPAGAFGRARARATADRPRPVRTPGWLRPALVSAMVILMVLGLGRGAYASTPGEPLFQLQRALDDVYVNLPRSTADSARASMSVADRRVNQAASVAKGASADALRLALNDDLRYLAQARAEIARLPGGQRHELASGLAAFEKAAANHLKDARNESNDRNNDEVLQEVESQLEQDAENDQNDGDNNDPARPAASATPQRSEQGSRGQGSSDSKQLSAPALSGTPAQGTSDERGQGQSTGQGAETLETEGTTQGDESTK